VEALILVIPAVALVLWLGWVIGTLAGPGGTYDFTTYYAAATALRLDPHANIYNAATLAHAVGPRHTPPTVPLPYTYPPLLAILLIPLSLLPFSAAATCWLLFNAGLWLLAALLLAGELRALLRPAFAQGGSDEQRGLADPARRTALALAFPLCLLAWPGGSALLLGQVSMLVLLPLALVPRLTRRGHEGWVGAAIGCAALLKFTPALLLGYLALRRRWRALAGALAALAALLLACTLLVGPGTFLAALPQALHVGADDAARPNNQALLGVLLVALDATAPALASLAHLLEYAALLAVLSIAAALLWRNPASSAAARLSADERADGEVLPYSIALCAMLLASPVIWPHHYAWLLPACALALGVALRRRLLANGLAARRGGGGTLAGVSAAIVLLNVSASYALQQGLARAPLRLMGFDLSVWANELPPLGALLLLFLAARMWRAPAQPTVSAISPQSA
jgi:alpha-1,2-mannosyltransferase